MLPSAAAAAAASQGRFWPMHDCLVSGPRPLDRSAIEACARDVGLDVARLRRDIDGSGPRDRVVADVELAESLGVRGTPTFFINGRPVEGAQPIPVFQSVIDDELEHAARLVAGGVAPTAIYDAILERAAPAGEPTPPPEGATEGRTDAIAARAAVDLGDPARRRGPDDALVTLVAFSDFECPFCSRVEPTLVALRKEFGDDLRIVFHDFPLAMHPHAQLAAEAAAAAAAQNKFWPFHDRLFAHQRALSRQDLERYAEAEGLDMSRFRDALDRRSHLAAVRAEVAAGRALGVSGTPTFFINGTRLVGAQPLARFRDVIEAERGRAQELLESGVSRDELFEVATLGPAAAARLHGGAQGQGETGSRVRAVDQVDLHIAALLACKAGRTDEAAALYARLTGQRRRALVREDCAVLGVTLSP
jgi:protein-disulfide isomerase